MTGPTVTRPAHFHRLAKGRKRLKDKAVEPVVVGGERIPREVQLLALAITFENMIRTGEARNYAEIARRTGVSRARITQIMRRVEMEPGEQELIILTRPAENAVQVAGHAPHAAIDLQWLDHESPGCSSPQPLL